MIRISHLGMQGSFLLIVILLFSFVTYSGATDIFADPVVFYYTGTPVIYAFYCLFVNFILNIIKNTKYSITDNSVFLFIRCITCLIPLLYTSETSTFFSHYLVVWVTLFAYVMGMCCDICKLDLYSKLFAGFVVLLCIQVIWTFKSIDVGYFDLSYKNYMNIPIAPSNVIATYLSPLLWIVVFNLNVRKLIKIMLSLLIIFSLILTKSRGGFVGLFITYIIYYMIKTRKQKMKIIIMLIVLCVILILLFQIPEVILFFEGFTAESSSRSADSLTSGRLSLFSEGLNAFMHNPILGNGITQNATHNVVGAHNLIIQLLLESGVLGLILYVVPILRVLRCSLRNIRQKYVLGFFLFSVGTLCHGQFEVNFFDYSTDIFFWFCIGLLNKINTTHENTSSKLRLPQGKYWQDSV